MRSPGHWSFVLRDVVFLQEPGAAAFWKVLTVLAQRHAGVILWSRLKALSRVNTDVIVL